MSFRREIEDQEMLAAIESLQTQDPLAPGVRHSDENREAQRAATEILCMLPMALDPIAPSSNAKRRLLDRVSRAQHVARFPVLSATEELSVRARALMGSHRTLRRLAAALAILMLGFALLSGWLLDSSRYQRSVIAELRQEIDAKSGRRIDPTAFSGTSAERLQQIALVIAPGTVICRLRPVGTHPLQPQARGALFVSADSNSFYLTIPRLEAPGEGLAYILWLVGESGALSQIEVPFAADTPVEVFSELLSQDFSAALLTLESQVGASEPKGPTILYGDEMERLL